MAGALDVRRPRQLTPPGVDAGGKDLPALAAALVTVLVWASAFVGIRSAGRGLSPGALSLGRLVVGLVVLTIVCLIRHERFPSRADLRPTWSALLPCGLLWFGVYNLTLNAGERRIDAGTAAMVVNVGPILIALLAGHFLHEGFPRNVLAGCAVAFSGVAVIALASRDPHSDNDGGPPLPDRSGRLRRRCRDPEGRPTPSEATADDMAVLCDRCRVFLALRPATRDRARVGSTGRDRLDRLSRHFSDRAGFPHLGLRA